MQEHHREMEFLLQQPSQDKQDSRLPEKTAQSMKKDLHHYKEKCRSLWRKLQSCGNNEEKIHWHRIEASRELSGSMPELTVGNGGGSGCNIMKESAGEGWESGHVGKSGDFARKEGRKEGQKRKVTKEVKGSGKKGGGGVRDRRGGVTKEEVGSGNRWGVVEGEMGGDVGGVRQEVPREIRKKRKDVAEEEKELISEQCVGLGGRGAAAGSGEVKCSLQVTAEKSRDKQPIMMKKSRSELRLLR